MQCVVALIVGEGLDPPEQKVLPYLTKTNVET